MEVHVSTVDMHRQERALMGQMVTDLPDSALIRVPDGYRNNILWNLGHIVVSQQLLLYKLSATEMHVPDELVDQFRAGSSPDDWEATPDIEQMKALLQELPERLQEDVEKERFGDYLGYTTSTGLALRTFEDGMAFNHFHEGVHTGIIMSLKKLVA